MLFGFCCLKRKVQEWWRSFIISGTPDYILNKIKHVKGETQRMEQRAQGELEGKKKTHPRSNRELGDREMMMNS